VITGRTGETGLETGFTCPMTLYLLIYARLPAKLTVSAHSGQF